ncbi:hypothetical protein [Bacillus kexueae]|uniref:hypothetical protein n=1 Tax=Aeribacillus kexueae TaxID=2078952 RepID=UPI001FAF117D|nr:hypothetical protein [Bacillus kexueae]
MSRRSFYLPTVAALFTIALLYGIGEWFEVSFLRWSYYEENLSSGGKNVEYGGSILPIIIGFAAGWGTKRIQKVII